MIVLFFLANLVAAPSTSDLDEFRLQDLPNAAVRVEREADGSYREVVIRQWVDRIKNPKGKDHYRRIEIGFDYIQGQAFRRSANLDGSDLQTVHGNNFVAGTTREEVLDAFELFSAHPDVAPLLKRDSVTLHGGFEFEDDPKVCPRANRCVHVFASTPDIAVLAQGIVRLRQRDVPYPHFDPAMTLASDPDKTRRDKP